MVSRCLACGGDVGPERALVLPNALGATCPRCLTITGQTGEPPRFFVAVAATTISRAREHLVEAVAEGRASEAVRSLLDTTPWILQVPEVLRDARGELPQVRVAPALFATRLGRGRPWMTTPLVPDLAAKLHEIETRTGVIPAPNHDPQFRAAYARTAHGTPTGEVVPAAYVPLPAFEDALVILDGTILDLLDDRRDAWIAAAPASLGPHPGFELLRDTATRIPRP